MITQTRLQDLLVYDPETGWFTNRVWRSYRSPPGQRAGSVKVNGKYRMISIDGTSYYEHRLAWLYVNGHWPEGVDHKDGDGCNNAWANLRSASVSKNMANADFPPGQSGLRGAYLRKETTSWFSTIQVGGQVKWLGTYDTAQEAHNAFLAAAEHHHGEFAFHNRSQNKEP